MQARLSVLFSKYHRAFSCIFRSSMENFHPLAIFAFLCLAVVVSHASLPSEVYWQTVLPNTPMPKTISDLLRPDIEGQSTAFRGTRTVEPDRDWFVYAAAGEQVEDDPTLDNFFLEKDLYPGTKKKLHLSSMKNAATFLPREIADSIPFSSSKLPELLDRFSVKPKSTEAEIMKKSIKLCEAPVIEGEDRYCATSLESLVDFTTLELGKKVQVLSTVVKNGAQEYYTIGVGVKMVGEKTVACHKLNYAYALFYCHSFHATRAYTVPLVDADGRKSKAVAICHTDTSSWNPKQMVFRVLKVKPGGVPVCHFLPDDHVLWIAN